MNAEAQVVYHPLDGSDLNRCPFERNPVLSYQLCVSFTIKHDVITNLTTRLVFSLLISSTNTSRPVAVRGEQKLQARYSLPQSKALASLQRAGRPPNVLQMGRSPKNC